MVPIHYLKQRRTWGLLITTLLTMTGVFAIMNGIIPALGQDGKFGLGLGQIWFLLLPLLLMRLLAYSLDLFQDSWLHALALQKSSGWTFNDDYRYWFGRCWSATTFNLAFIVGIYLHWDYLCWNNKYYVKWSGNRAFTRG